MKETDPRFRYLGPEDFAYGIKVTMKPDVKLVIPKRTCRLCLWLVEDPTEEDPFICLDCLRKAHGALNLSKPRSNNPLWDTLAGQQYEAALAAYRALNSELMRIRFQRRTGRMGDHPAWHRQTREQREAWANQPAPPRAYMP